MKLLASLASALLVSATDGGALRPQNLSRVVHIDADHLKILDKVHEGQYTGHVRVRTGTTTITCDRLVAYYTESQETGTQEFSRIVCDGNVEAIDRDRRVKGDHGDFHNDSGVLVITGEHGVEIWDGKTHVSGTSATFGTHESTLEVEHPKTLIDQAPPGGGRDGGTPRRAAKDAGH